MSYLVQQPILAILVIAALVRAEVFDTLMTKTEKFVFEAIGAVILLSLFGQYDKVEINVLAIVFLCCSLIIQLLGRKRRIKEKKLNNTLNR